MNRRDFLTVGTPRHRSSGRNLGAAGTDGSGGQNPPAFARRTMAGLESYSGPWTYAEAAHLLRRCTIGPTEAEIRQAVTDGMAATISKLLTPFTPALTGIDAWAGKEVPVRPLNSADYQAFQQEMQVRRELLGRWWLKTMATAPLSMQERMTLFWHNHFTSEMQTVQFAEFMYVQNQLLRNSAFGNFKQFVKDVTKDVAMLIYLDGSKNFKSGARNNINENYARELMELFTTGVVDWDGNPNYTETDVAQAARALSGYNLTVSATSDGKYQYVTTSSSFSTLRWDPGDKTVLGKTGKFDADGVVDVIFSERADQTAKFVCEKIYRAFVYDVPDRTVIADMAETFKSGNWEIRPVIQQLLQSAHFYDVTNIGALDKGPVDYMIGMIRGLGLKLTTVPDFDLALTNRFSRDLTNRLVALGQTVLDPPNVKGWPGGRTWISTSTLPPRQKFGLDVLDAKIVQQRKVLYEFDPIAFAKTFPNYDDIEKLSQEMSLYLLNSPPSQKEAGILYDTLLDGGKSYEWDIESAEQKPAERIRKCMAAIFKLAKYQLY